MGLGLFKRCYTYSTTDTPTRAVAPDPSPAHYSVEDTRYFKSSDGEIKATLLKVKYLGCTNYEGTKILVYLGQFTPQGELDPHFSEEYVSPIARFKPNREGKELATRFCKALVEKHRV
jgi:hypothetical protein